MTLTRENYYQFLEHEGKPVMSASTVKYAYPGQGGSLAVLSHFLKQQAEKEEDEEEKKHQRLGQLLHKWIEDKNQFEVEVDDKPDDWICKIIGRAFPEIHNHRTIALANQEEAPDTLLAYPDILAQARIGIQGNWKDETVVQKVIALGEPYYQFLRKAEGKRMISAPEKASLEGMQRSIANSPYAELLLEKKSHEGTVLSETPILWHYGIIPCKSMIDIIKVYPSAYKAYVDEIKTTSGPVSTFMYKQELWPHSTETVIQKLVPGPAYRYRYYRQHGMYNMAVKEHFLKTLGEEFYQRVELYHGYYVVQSVEPFEVTYHRQPREGVAIGRLEIEHASRVWEEYINQAYNQNRGF